MRHNKWLSYWGIVLLGLVLLAGCAPKSSDDDDDDGGTQPTSAPTTTIATTNDITARVSDGAPIASAGIATQCGTDTTKTASGTTTSADGSATVTVTNATFPCIVTATKGTTTLRSVSTQSGDAVNVNPVSEVVVAQLSIDGAARQGVRQGARTLSSVDAAAFNSEGKSVVDQVFNGGFNFSDFDKDYTDTNVKSNGSNLADTLFRSVDATVGGLSDLKSIITKANDATDTSVSGSFLDDPAFQAVVATEVVALSGGNEETDLDTEIQTINTVEQINQVRTRVNDLVRNDTTTITKAARVAGAVLHNVIKNTEAVTDLDVATSNIIGVTGSTIQSIATGQNESEGKAVGQQIGSTLAKATDFSNASSVTAKAAILPILSEKTKTIVETTIDSAATNLSDKKKDEFLEQMASAAVGFVLKNEAAFLTDPANVDTGVGSTADSVAKNTATAFKKLETVLNADLSSEVAENALGTAAKETKNNIEAIVATNPTTISGGLTIEQQVSNVGQNVGDFVATVAGPVSLSAGSATDSSRQASVTAASISAAFQNASSGKVLTATGTDLVDTTAAAQATAELIANKLGSSVNTLTNVSGNILEVVIQSAAVRSFSGAVTNTVSVDTDVDKGITQMIETMDALGDLGFDVAKLADQLIDSEVNSDRLASTVEILETTFTGKEVGIAGSTEQIITATVQTAATATDVNFEANVSQVTEVLDTALEQNLTSDFAAIVNTVVELSNNNQEVTLTAAVNDATTLNSQASIDSVTANAQINATSSTTQIDNVVVSTTVGETIVTKPVVISYVPARNTQLVPESGKLGVAVDSDFVMTFDRAVTVATPVKDITLTCTGGTTCTDVTIAANDGQVTINGAVVTINPTNNLDSEKKYQLIVAKDAFDSEGKGSNAIVWNFETADTTAPAITSRFPSSTTQNTGVNTDIVLNFNEKVKIGTGTITVGTSSFNVTGSAVTGGNTNKITINPGTLAVGTITVTIPPTAFTDLSGNAFASTDFVFAFNVTSDTIGWGLSGNQVTLSRGNSAATAAVAANGEVNSNTAITFYATDGGTALPEMTFTPVAKGQVSDSNSVLGWNITSEGDNRRLQAILLGATITVDEAMNPPMTINVPVDAKMFISGTDSFNKNVGFTAVNLSENGVDQLFTISGGEFTVNSNALRTIIQARLGIEEDRFLNLGEIGTYTYEFYIQSSALPGFLSNNNDTITDFPNNGSALSAGPSFDRFTIDAGAARLIKGKYTIALGRDISVTAPSTSEGTITGLGSGTTPVSDGSTVTLVAAPEAGKVLTGWSGVTCAAEGLTCSFTANANMTIEAMFAEAALTLNSSAGTLIEGTASSNSVTITATLNGYSDQDLTFNVTDSSDRTTLSASTISIAAGTLAPTSGVTLTTIPNTTGEATEIVTVTASVDITGGGTITGSTAITLEDDDLPVVSLSLPNGATVAENAGTVTVRATLSEALQVASSATITVTGTATSGTDYASFSARVDFPVGATTQEFTLTGIDDAVDDDAETIILTLTAASPDGELVANPDPVTITITDDDAAPVVSLSVAASSIADSGEATTIIATLDKTSTAAVTINLTEGGTTADYSLSASQIVVPAGSLTGTATLTAKTDTVEALNGDAIVSLGTIANGSAGTPNSVTVAISDSEAYTGNRPAVKINATTGKVQLYINPSQTSLTISTMQLFMTGCTHANVNAFTATINADKFEDSNSQLSGTIGTMLVISKSGVTLGTETVLVSEASGCTGITEGAGSSYMITGGTVNTALTVVVE